MLYTEELLEHYRNPQNFHKMEQPTSTVTLRNPLCGDVLTLYLQTKRRAVIDASFQGEGCSISIAAASIFTQYLKGKSTTVLQKIDAKRMMSIVGITVSPGRIKCLLLPLEALKQSLRQIP